MKNAGPGKAGKTFPLGHIALSRRGAGNPVTLIIGIYPYKNLITKSAKMAAEIQADIAELNLIATRRLGEISAALEKAKVRGNQHTADVRVSDNGKTATLSSVGISRQRANEAEKLARIDEGVFNRQKKLFIRSMNHIIGKR